MSAYSQKRTSKRSTLPSSSSRRTGRYNIRSNSRILSWRNPASASFHTVLTTVPTGLAPSTSHTSVAVTPDGTRAYVTYPTDSRVAVIDTDPGSGTFHTVLATIPAGTAPLRVVTVVPDGTCALITEAGSPGSMLILDTDPSSPTFHTVIDAVPVGNTPTGVVFQKLFAFTGTFAYVSNPFEDTVSVIGITAVEVAIDIKPASDPNSINLGSQGTVPVAIFSTETFDATQVDPTTVTLADAGVKVRGKGTPMASTEDVDGDGRLDLVVHVETEGLSVTLGDTEAVLQGELFDGTPIRGSDSIRVIE